MEPTHVRWPTNLLRNLSHFLFQQVILHRTKGFLIVLARYVPPIGRKCLSPQLMTIPTAVGFPEGELLRYKAVKSAPFPSTVHHHMSCVTASLRLRPGQDSPILIG